MDAFLLKELRKFETGIGERGKGGPYGPEVVKLVADTLRFLFFLPCLLSKFYGRCPDNRIR